MLLQKQQKPQQPNNATTSTDTENLTEQHLVDGRPLYYSDEQIVRNVRSFMSKTAQDDPKVPPILPYDEEVFREWAETERARYKSGYRGGIAESDESEAPSESDGYLSLRLTPRLKRKPIRRNQNVIKHLSGYMYGPFTRPPTPDSLTKVGNKFGIPHSMIERARRYYRKCRIQNNVLRRVRLSHMGFEQPPSSKDESSDDNESVKNVKRLALVRTPYFILPTVRISQVRRKDRFRSKFLKKDRLKRVNLLLGDSNRAGGLLTAGSGASARGRMTDEEYIQQKRSVFAKFFQLTARKQKAVVQPPRRADKAEYYNLIRQQYEKAKKACEAAEVQSKAITFQQFMAMPATDEDGDCAAAAEELRRTEEERKRLAAGKMSKEARAKLMKARFQVSQPKKLFQRSKNERLSKEDEVVGPFYIDPNLMDKFRSPKKCI